MGYEKKIACFSLNVYVLWTAIKFASKHSSVGSIKDYLMVVAKYIAMAG
jgi:hypothetical protein